MMNVTPILGFSAFTSLGATLEEHTEALRAGRSGLKVGSELLENVDCAIGEIRYPLSKLPPTFGYHDSRCHQLLSSCLSVLKPRLESLKAVVPPEKIGIVVATSASGNYDLERAHRLAGCYEYNYHGNQSFGSLPSMVRKIIGVNGPAFAVCTACSSGGNAMISARNLIRSGVCELCLVGSVDSLCQTTYKGFRSLRAMDSQPCRPFDVAREGLSLGEGSSVLLLGSSALGQKFGDELFFVGFGASSDAHHMTAPDPEGRGAGAAMENALFDAGLKPDQIGYLNLHGTGTPLNDSSEAKAVERLLGREVPCSSTKGYTGHLLGAAAGVESVISLLSLRDGVLPRNLNLVEKDPEIAIRILKTDEKVAEGTFIMSNSFAFGGNNTSMIFGRLP